MLIGTRGATGGHKMILRHVEALVQIGFDAVAYVAKGEPEPRWFQHSAPIVNGGVLNDDDILVIPEDAISILKGMARSLHKKIVFCQNHFYAAAIGIGHLSKEELKGYRDFIACGYSSATWLAKFFPGSSVNIIPAFADERSFQPAEKQPVIAFTPRKRPMEARCVQFMFNRLYQGTTKWRWAALQSVTEAAVADMFGTASVFLSLNRFEGCGITSLEAMKAGCVVAGFTGLGGREYATTANGFWVEEDDCEACTFALLEAVKLVEAAGDGLRLVKKAAMKTADDWSHVRFVAALESFWRTRSGEM
jgi:hypothetical protein